MHNLAKLPEVCYTILNTTGELIALKRNEPGYWPITSRATAAELNATLGVTDRQVMAMEAGSLFGWNIPAADPDSYTDADAATWCEQLKRRAARAKGAA